MIEQRGMINHLWAKVRDLGLNSDDVLAQTASQCFDISVWQFLAPLMVGAQVRIVPAEQAIDPVELLREVRESGVTCWRPCRHCCVWFWTRSKLKRRAGDRQSLRGAGFVG
jgi:non-ribosomal peptide synthetase component F